MRETEDKLRSEAAKVEREANAIFAKMEAAAKPDRCGSRPLIPPGFEVEAERASDLIRRARVLTAEANEMRPVAASVVPQPSYPPARAAKSSGLAPDNPHLRRPTLWPLASFHHQVSVAPGHEARHLRS